MSDEHENSNFELTCIQEAYISHVQILRLAYLESTAHWWAPNHMPGLRLCMYFYLYFRNVFYQWNESKFGKQLTLLHTICVFTV